MGNTNITADSLIKGTEKDRAIAKQLPYTLLVNVPIIASITWVYWGVVDHFWLLVWSGLMTAILIYRIITVLLLYRHFFAGVDKKWQRIMLVGNSAVSGLMWGWAGVLFFVPEQFEYQIIILLFLIFKGFGSATAVSSNFLSFLLYFPVSMAPICIMFFMEQTKVSLLLGLGCFGSAITLVFLAKNLNRSLSELIDLRNKNELLLEEALQQKNIADNANTEKSRFLAAASHDLRQPLYALSLLSEALDEQDKEKNRKDISRKIKASINSLETLFNALLNISRLDSGTITLEITNINLTELLAKLVDEFSPIASSKNLFLEWPKESYWVRSDINLVEQILRNLISNALSYTDQGGVTIKVCESNQDIQITVSDTGQGIEEKHQAKIFNEFYQVNNAERDRNKGIGLGLAIVDRSIKLLKSKITLTSTIGQGSSISFHLPKGSAKVLSSPLIEQQALSTQLNLEVIIIEDDKEVAEALQLLLTHWGCQLMIFSNGDDLIDQFKHTPITADSIISDFQLPGKYNGLELILRIKKMATHSIPALIITGNLTLAEKNGLKDNNVSILQKPASPSKIRAFLQHCKKIKNNN